MANTVYGRDCRCGGLRSDSARSDSPYHQKEGLLENLPLNRALGAVVNIGRSVPFLVLMVAIIPVTKLIVGTFIGTTAAIVPLTIGAIPFVARLIESALLEVPTGLVEAAQSMGATPLQIIRKVLLPEALPTILNSVTITLVTLVSYSAMAVPLAVVVWAMWRSAMDSTVTTSPSWRSLWSC